MNRKDRALVLAAALAVHALGFALIDASMVAVSARELLARWEPDRIVVTAPGALKRTLATQSCPAPRG